VKVAPLSGSLVAVTLPPWASTMARVIARPRPLWPAPPLRARSPRCKRSKMCGRSSGEIPGLSVRGADRPNLLSEYLKSAGALLPTPNSTFDPSKTRPQEERRGARRIFRQ